MGLKPGERHQLHEINPGLCKQVPKKHPWDKMAEYHQQLKLVEKDH